MMIPSPDRTQQQLLAEALQLARFLTRSPTVDPDTFQRWQNRLRQIRENLKTFAHPLQHNPLPLEAIPLDMRQTFVRAAMLLTRYHQLGASDWQGTLDSPTLSQYQPNPIPANLLAENALETLCQRFALSAEFQADVTVTLQSIDRLITQQTQIIHTLLSDSQSLSPASPTSPDSPSSTDRASTKHCPYLPLFHHLFGNIPIPAAALGWIHTPMQIYFCIDYQDEQLRHGELWESLNNAEREQIQNFLRSLNQFSFEQFQRFPIFGPCDPRQLDPTWCDRIAQLTGTTPAEIIQTLSHSVSIIPTYKAEAFLVHDIWGHHWQLLLTQFSSDYHTLRHCGEPLRAAETAYTADGPLSCRELFICDGKQVSVDTDKARLFFRGEVQQRLGLLFTHLIGEMLADMVEFKFIWDSPTAADQLLSSSLFKAQPTKLDLSLADLDFLFLRVLRSLLEVQVSVWEESDLEQDLLAEWDAAGLDVESLEVRTSLKQAVLQLYQTFLEEYNATYLPTMTGETGVFTQIISNLLYLQNAIDSLYTDTTTANQAGLPFQDLLMLFIGCYCAKDSYADFWAIDDVLAAYFLPCWHWLWQKKSA